MRFVCFISLVAALAAGFSAALLRAQVPAKESQEKAAAFDETALDEKILADARLATDGPALLQYFRDRTYKEADPNHLALLIKQLGDEKFAVREKAYAELLKLGPSALVVVKDAANHPDQEVRLRALELRKGIEERTDPGLQAAVARLIGQRKPAGAVQVLLAYAPFAADEWVVEEINKSLTLLAVRDGKAEPALVEALSARSAVERGVAGAALVAAGAREHFAAVRALLKDGAAAVRVRVAHALVREARDKDALPVLIECLRELPAEKLGSAEELLLRIAGEKAPSVSLGADEPSRKKCFEEWDRWWKENNKGIDLARLEFSTALMGYTLLAYQNQPGPAAAPFLPGGTVLELDSAKHVRWKFNVPNFCSHAEVVGPNRVLVVERNNNLVTERDFQGNIKWQQNVATPVVAAQRLPNGNIFVVTQVQLIEYSPNGKEVYNFAPPNRPVYRGRKMANGDVVYITPQGGVSRVDSKTSNEIASFNVGILNNIYGNLQELPNGNLLLPLYTPKKVAEFDRTGKEVWSIQLEQYPFSATRLPNGNTLVAVVQSANKNNQVVEYDRNQREVWSHQVEGTVLVARKR